MRKVTIYPDPFTIRISMEIVNEENENAIVCMQNEQDRIIKMFSWHLKPGTNKTSLDGLQSLPDGSYHISIKNIDGTVFSNKVIYKGFPKA